MVKTTTKKHKPAARSKRAPKMSGRETLIGALSELLGDDALLELIERADASNDPIGVLKRALDGNTPIATDGSDPDTLPAGVELIEKTVSAWDVKTRAFIEKPVGWIIQRQDAAGPAVAFAGGQLVWMSYGRAAAFETQFAATKAARTMQRMHEQAANSPSDFEIRELTLSGVPCRSGNSNERPPAQITLQLSGQQTTLLYNVLAAMRRLKVEHDGRPLRDVGDVVKFILSRLC